MLEYWDKENWNVTLSTDPRLAAALEHGSREGAVGRQGKWVCLTATTYVENLSPDPHRACPCAIAQLAVGSQNCCRFNWLSPTTVAVVQLHIRCRVQPLVWNIGVQAPT